MGPKLSVSVRVEALGEGIDRAMGLVCYARVTGFARAAGNIHSTARRLPRADYFLRKRSSRTTSAPSLGFADSSAVSVEGAETGRPAAAGVTGRLAAGVSAATSVGSNCRPNCTEGSKKLLMELKG